MDRKDRHDPSRIALRALDFLASRPDLLRGFMQAGDVSSSDLRLHAEDAEFLAAILDFLMLEDAWITAFAAYAGLSPDQVMHIRARLPGGDSPHWT